MPDRSNDPDESRSLDDASQIEIPPSFFALYGDPRRTYRLSEPIGLVRARYEACEDLATALVEQARVLVHVEVPSEFEVLTRIHAGLRSEGSGVSPAEAGWVVTRLAELLDWRLPDLDGAA